MTEQQEKLSRQLNNVQVRQKDSRENADEKFAEHIAKLEERAQTSEQKQAVAAFKTAVSKAIRDRRAAVDEARDEFHDGLADLADDRNTAALQAAERYRTAVKTALQNAERSCGQNVEPAKIREQVKTALEAGREEYGNKEDGLSKYRKSANELAEVKNTAVKTAQETFKTAIAKAIDDLKKAFPQNTATSTDSE